MKHDKMAMIIKIFKCLNFNLVLCYHQLLSDQLLRMTKNFKIVFNAFCLAQRIVQTNLN